MRLISRRSDYREPGNSSAVGVSLILNHMDFVYFGYVFWLEAGIYEYFTGRQLVRTGYG